MTTDNGSTGHYTFLNAAKGNAGRLRRGGALGGYVVLQHGAASDYSIGNAIALAGHNVFPVDYWAVAPIGLGTTQDFLVGRLDPTGTPVATFGQ